ncbi:MAG: dicarboxylate/amino acid:cation symporter [candidate division FCPU426 bacterium]
MKVLKPLYQRILVGVAAGLLAGLILHARAAVLGDLGMLVIRLLKALATPLILFAVLDAFLRTQIPGRKGMALIGISLMNAVVALAIGLGVAHFVGAGRSWQGRPELSAAFSTVAPAKPAEGPAPSLNLLDNIAGYVPENLVDPFRKNQVISVVLLAVLLGLALRRLKDSGTDIEALEKFVNHGFKVMVQLLEWVILLLPFAVFGVVAKVSGATGAGVFGMLGIFLLTMIVGLVLHGWIYYPCLAWLAGGINPRRFFSGCSDAIVAALGSGSSLATLPVTLRCLREKLGISEGSAHLAACVGTNLNHDGIILYEMAATVFMAQAFGVHLGWAGIGGIALASVMAGVGIAGIPEAGLITLPLVLAAAGLPEGAAIAVIPLVLPVDWIVGRFRAAVNVTSDMTVAMLLDRDA